MSKRNKILISVLVAAVLALLIALCFVGNTFARYTLKQTETVSANIAEWGVTVDDSGVSDHNISVEGLKPSAAKFTDGESPRSSADDDTDGSNFVLVATLTNTGAVKANVTITESGTVASTATYQAYSDKKAAQYHVEENQFDSDGNYVPGEDHGYGGSEDTTTGTAYASQIGSHILADVYYDTTGGTNGGNEDPE